MSHISQSQLFHQWSMACIQTLNPNPFCPELAFLQTSSRRKHTTNPEPTSSKGSKISTLFKKRIRLLMGSHEELREKTRHKILWYALFWLLHPRTKESAQWNELGFSSLTALFSYTTTTTHCCAYTIHIIHACPLLYFFTKLKGWFWLLQLTNIWLNLHLLRTTIITHWQRRAKNQILSSSPYSQRLTALQTLIKLTHYPRQCHIQTTN